MCFIDAAAAADDDDDDAESHLLKHGDPKHKCRYCPFATRQLQSLRIHEHRIHTNYRPHLCEACGKSFVKSTLLKEHINGMSHKSHHVPCPVPCYAVH